MNAGFTSGLAAFLLLTSTSAFAEGHGDGKPAIAMDLEGAERGEYLSTVAGCHTCHASPDGTPWAGGSRLETPFGPLYGPNITQDRETGIGTWTRDDFEGALRRGVNEEGEYLYPAMPYTHYTKIIDEDIDALWAYFQTIEPVRNEVEINQLPFPFNIRTSLLAWQTLYLDEARYRYRPDETEEWNEGAYMVNALAHCSSCHTPRDSLGGPIEEKALQGAFINGWYAPNISDNPDSVIRDWDVERLAAFLRDAESDNHVAVSEMKMVVADMKAMEEDDVRAIAVFLKNRTYGKYPARMGPVPLSDAQREEGQAIFTSNCVSCHQENGEGVPGVAASLAGSGTVLADNSHNMIKILLKGIAPNDDYGVMPSFADALTDDEIASVINYVRTAWGNDAAPNANSAMVDQLRLYTETDPVADLAVVCPNPAADVLSDDVRAKMDALTDTPGLDEPAMEALLAEYEEDFPDVPKADRLLALTGLYCQSIASKLTDTLDKGDLVTTQIDFQQMIVRLDRQ